MGNDKLKARARSHRVDLSEENFVNTGDSINEFADAIDQQVQDNKDDISTLTTTTIPNLEAKIGTLTYVDECNVTDDDPLTDSIEDLDNAIGCRTYTEDNNIADGEAVSASLNKLDMVFQGIDIYDVSGGQSIN